jgi:hypothetical protein
LTNQKNQEGNLFDEKYLTRRKMEVVINQSLDKVSAYVIAHHVNEV